MSIERRRIPPLPERPRVHPIGKDIVRSYPVGSQSVSRACLGETLVLTITSQDALPEGVRANLVTTLGSKRSEAWEEIPFTRLDDRTLTCRVLAAQPGLRSFRAEFSVDGGLSWIRDTVPDAWVLVEPPQVDGLRLYSLIPTVSGTLSDWQGDLGRIRDMGFNAVHLLPVTALDTSQSPYAARDLFDVDHSYLLEGVRRDGLSQLEDFVEAAKALGIRLCFDLVLNHVGANSTMARRAPDWIVPDESQPDGLRRARYLSDGGWRNWGDLVLINYQHPSEEIRSEIWAYMTDYALFWAKYADVTGGFVRFDNLHSSEPEFIDALTARLHAEYPGVGLLAEYFTDEHTLLHNGPHWGLNLILATPWQFKFVPQLRDYLTYLHRVSEHVRYFMPITSHDSGSPAQEFGGPDSTIPRYVASALLGTGATGIPQGVELGEAKRIDFIGRKPRMTFPSNPRFAPFLRQVNDILAKYPAFRCGGNCRFVDAGHPAILAAHRSDASGETAGFLVVCNFDTAKPQSITLDLAAIVGRETPSSFVELLSGEEGVLAAPQLEIQLGPCATKVLKLIRRDGSQRGTTPA